jgi:hypothetical protein
VLEVDRQLLSAFFVALVEAQVGPLPQEGLDHSFRFAVRLGPVWPRPLQLDATLSGELFKSAIAIVEGVVGEHTLDPDAHALEVIDGALQEANGGAACLIG